MARSTNGWHTPVKASDHKGYRVHYNADVVRVWMGHRGHWTLIEADRGRELLNPVKMGEGRTMDEAEARLA
jgi:hypothetical protein